VSFDAASKARLRMIYPDVAIRLVRAEQDMLRINQLQLRVTEAIRTLDYQARLYARGRELRLGSWVVVDRRAVVTNSPPGFSVHHFGLAVDCCFAGPDPYLVKETPKRRDFLWSEYGRIARAHGLQWGGDWNGNGQQDSNDWDRPHVQLCYGFRLQEIREFYKTGGMEGVWRAADKARGVPEGTDWYGPLPQKRLLEIGLLP
jgi:hypothetical protein